MMEIYKFIFRFLINLGVTCFRCKNLSFVLGMRFTSIERHLVLKIRNILLMRHLFVSWQLIESANS